MERHRTQQPTRLLRFAKTATATSNLETAELNLGHRGDLLHSVLDHFCRPFQMLEGRKELFRLRVPATLAYQQVFGITLEGGGKD
jgi:hypothetical protein